MKKIKEHFNRYGIHYLLGLVIILSLSTCTNSCSKNKYKKKYEITRVYPDSLNWCKIDYENLKVHNDSVQTLLDSTLKKNQELELQLQKTEEFLKAYKIINKSLNTTIVDIVKTNATTK